MCSDWPLNGFNTKCNFLSQHQIVLEQYLVFNCDHIKAFVRSFIVIRARSKKREPEAKARMLLTGVRYFWSLTTFVAHNDECHKKAGDWKIIDITPNCSIQENVRFRVRSNTFKRSFINDVTHIAIFLSPLTTCHALMY